MAEMALPLNTKRGYAQIHHADLISESIMVKSAWVKKLKNPQNNAVVDFPEILVLVCIF